MTGSIITPQRITRFIQSRFNPIRSLTPEWLSSMIDSFDAGFLREFSLMADAIERRDDILSAVAPKRKKAIGRNGYEIVTSEKSAKADAHKKTLEHFYGHVTALNAVSENERGGFKLLVRQMADAIGKKYAVHEIVWKPTPMGLTAEFRFAPLWFFENRFGRLRYLTQEGMIDGIELDPNNWLVTVGDGLMLPCAIAYMFKNLPLKDWLIYCERFGMPIPIGSTNAPKDSPEWSAMLGFVEAIMSGAAAVKSTGDTVETLDIKGGATEMPHPKLVERMDRAMSSMWRGSDLSTMSRGGQDAGQSSGASVQGEESEILEVDDTEWISETLNIGVTRFVIQYEHGDDEPLAYIKVLTSKKQDVAQDLAIDQFLLTAGFPLDLQSVSERYGRPIPEGSDDLLEKPVAPAAPGEGDQKPGDKKKTKAANIRRLFNTAEDVHAFFESPEGSALLENALKKKERELVSDAARPEFIAARKLDLAPLAARLSGILAIPSEEEQRGALIALKIELPKLLKVINANPRTAPVLAGVMSAEFFNGLENAEEREAANV